jgi:hydroxyethylthiazole kinase
MTTIAHHADLPARAVELLDRVRSATPRVHCLMNVVVPKFVADGLTALGAIPSMTSSVEEVEAFVRKADALAVNLGTLDAQRREAIWLAVAEAAGGGKPWVLDPAHCDYSPPRGAFARELLAAGPAALRANQAEFALLEVAGTIVAVETGTVDRISAGGARVAVGNGHPLMAKVTGTGCLSGAVIAAFLAVEPDGFVAAASAMLAIGVAGEIAAGNARGPGTFEPALLDAIAALRGDDILDRAKVSHDKG